MFSDLQITKMSEYAVMAAHANMAKLDLFAHTFTELEGVPGQSVAVPVYDLTASGEFDADTNNYGSGSNEVGGLLVGLDKHLVKSVAITDKQLSFTGINWAKDTSYALADRVTRDANAYVMGLFNATNISKSETLDVSTKTAVASLYQIAAENDIPVDRAVVILEPASFAKVMAIADHMLVGDGDYVKTGVIKQLFGFKAFVCSTFLPNGVKGVIALDEAVGIVSKYLAPGTSDVYPFAMAASNEDGLTIGFRGFMDLAKGYNILACDVLLGAKILQPAKCVRLV